MKKIWIVVIVLVFVVIIFFVKNTYTENLKSNVDSTNHVQQTNDSSTLGSTNTMNLSKNIVVMTVNGGEFYFKPNIIKVKQGDTLDITFINDGGFHDFKIDELNVATDKIAAGAQTKVTFVANKKGSFVYYCSVGTHRQKGMWGTLVVE